MKQNTKAIKTNENKSNITNNNIETNSQTLNIYLLGQLENAKRQKKEVLYEFKSKQPIDTTANKSNSNLKHQGLYPSETTVLVGDPINNDVIEEKISKNR